MVNDARYARELALAGVGLAYQFEPLARRHRGGPAYRGFAKVGNRGPRFISLLPNAGFHGAEAKGLYRNDKRRFASKQTFCERVVS